MIALLGASFGHSPLLVGNQRMSGPYGDQAAEPLAKYKDGPWAQRAAGGEKYNPEPANRRAASGIPVTNTGIPLAALTKRHVSKRGA
jgi:hypothetical protein